ncbi:hypothetical protein D9758_004443 [Tetrapyrgos nigripes]|uniref:Cytochrome P450 n=1 Tax=Tetrapyrgos nigripes TaxID=182062 RepID=A0A8H5LSL9_9AGAR|nr:hypothetical protein D9758_004443 [Tetrapyrgos nigripes]
MTSTYLFLAFLVFLLLFLVYRYRKHNYDDAVPPGPPGLPIIGNLLQLTSSNCLWLVFESWKETYGPIIHLSIPSFPSFIPFVHQLNQSIIILNTHKVAYDLLSKRSALYSDRPRLIVANETLTRNGLLGLARWGEKWRRTRRAAHESLKKEMVVNGSSGRGGLYDGIIMREGVLLAAGLGSITTTPAAGNGSTDWLSHLSRTSSSLFTSIAYDTPPLHSPQDPLIHAVCSLTTHVTRASYPGAHLVEILPFLNDLPKWIPGVNWVNRWKKEAEDAYERYTEAFEGIYGEVEERVRREGENEKNEGKGSFARKLVETNHRHRLTKTEASWLAASMFVAGADTTANTMAWLLTILAKYRDVQAKAAAEIHAYLASASTPSPTSTNASASASASLSSPPCPRLPTPTDLPNLPYCRAVLRESMRWRPVDPLGLPHVCVEDDVYVCVDAESSSDEDVQFESESESESTGMRNGNGNGEKEKTQTRTGTVGPSKPQPKQKAKTYLIKKGTILLPNVWAMNRDVEVYGEDAEEFRPERFLERERVAVDQDSESPEGGGGGGGGIKWKWKLVSGVRDPSKRDKEEYACLREDGMVNFGFGRRLRLDSFDLELYCVVLICVGRHLAMSSILFNMVMILWAWEVLPPRNGNGDGEEYVEPKLGIDDEVRDGVVVRPLTTPLHFSPRFPDVQELLERAEEGIWADADAYASGSRSRESGSDIVTNANAEDTYTYTYKDKDKDKEEPEKEQEQEYEKSEEGEGDVDVEGRRGRVGEEWNERLRRIWDVDSVKTY